jgi:hypothetical protein
VNGVFVSDEEARVITEDEEARFYAKVGQARFNINSSRFLYFILYVPFFM